MNVEHTNFIPQKIDVRMVPPRDPSAPRNAFTIDVEDWYQSCVDYDAPITARVRRNVEDILDLLNDHDVKATFFVQGKVAEAFPNLVHTLVVEGHEVQSHGYSHRPLHGMSRSELRNELERAKKTVEDAAGVRVTSFRAQDFSIVESNLWALEVLAEFEFTTDSSIFAMRTRHYGIADWPTGPHYLVNGTTRILEVPVAIWSTRWARIPVAGGGYFRVIPRWTIEHGLRSMAKERPAVVYCHPYEFNADELSEFGHVRRRYRASQKIGRRAFPARICRLLSQFSFGRMGDVLKAWGLTEDDPSQAPPSVRAALDGTILA